ncbi:MAG: copper resistance protein [Alphaproteobacteria bacterium]|nr:copper resistance protein [Alphaproteobacteria bacterium]
MDELIIASRAVHFAAVALLFGAPLFRLAVAPRGFELAGRAARWTEPLAAAAALLSGLGWFAGVAAEMAGSWSEALTPDILAAVTQDTRFGRLWVVRLTLIVAILVIQAAAKPSRGRDIALLLLTAAMTASLVGVGHGMAGSGRLAAIHMVADMAHLLCAATWIGGLFFLGLAVQQTVRRRAGTPADAPAELDALRRVLRRFSHIGYGAVALLVGSGCINALILVPQPGKLIGTYYGRVLLVKIALALVMVAVAVVNRLLLTPPVMTSRSPAGVETLRRSIVVEQGIGFLVLGTVALLGTIHPVP